MRQFAGDDAVCRTLAGMVVVGMVSARAGDDVLGMKIGVASWWVRERGSE